MFRTRALMVLVALAFSHSAAAWDVSNVLAPTSPSANTNGTSGSGGDAIAGAIQSGTGKQQSVAGLVPQNNSASSSGASAPAGIATDCQTTSKDYSAEYKMEPIK